MSMLDLTGQILTNQSCIVKIFSVNILHLEYNNLSALTYNIIYDQRELVYQVMMSLHDYTAIFPFMFGWGNRV